MVSYMEEYLYKRPEKPLGVAILSVLEIIGGLLMLISGIVMMVAVPYITTISSFPYKMPLIITPILGFVAGIVMLIIGIIFTFLGYLLWRGSDLARVINIILAIIGIIGSLFVLPIGIIGIFIDIIIIFYLTRSYVVEFFKG